MAIPPVSYCDVPDLGRFGVNAEALERMSDEETKIPAIQGASAMIDDYLRDQFTLPLITWGTSIRRAAAIIAVYDIFTVRGGKPGDNPEDSILQIRYDDVIKWLKLVATGTVAPDVVDSDTTTPLPGAPSGVARITSNTQRGYFNTGPGRALPFQGGRR